MCVCVCVFLHKQVFQAIHVNKPFQTILQLHQLVLVTHHLLLCHNITITSIIPKVIFLVGGGFGGFGGGGGWWW